MRLARFLYGRFCATQRIDRSIGLRCASTLRGYPHTERRDVDPPGVEPEVADDVVAGGLRDRDHPVRRPRRDPRQDRHRPDGRRRPPRFALVKPDQVEQRDDSPGADGERRAAVREAVDDVEPAAGGDDGKGGRLADEMRAVREPRRHAYPLDLARPGRARSAVRRVAVDEERQPEPRLGLEQRRHELGARSGRRRRRRPRGTSG